MLKRKRRHKLGTSNTDPARFNKSQIKIYGYLIPISIVMLLPIIYIVVSAFKPMDELFAYPPRFYVKNPTFDNFRRLFEVSSDTAISAGRYLLCASGSFYLRKHFVAKMHCCRLIIWR